MTGTTLSTGTSSEWKLREAKRCLLDGGVIAYPTEAVYGLGCDPLNPHAIARLLQLKRRVPEKGFILIASECEQLLPFIDIDPDTRERLEESWPGPITWIVPAAQNVPEWITGGRETIAVRVTAHPLASALCNHFGGALISTSANQSGKSAAKSALQVRQRLQQLPDMILNGPLGKLSRPTPIRHAVTGEILRQ